VLVQLCPAVTCQPCPANTELGLLSLWSFGSYSSPGEHKQDAGVFAGREQGRGQRDQTQQDIQ